MAARHHRVQPLPVRREVLLEGCEECTATLHASLHLLGFCALRGVLPVTTAAERRTLAMAVGRLVLPSEPKENVSREVDDPFAALFFKAIRTSDSPVSRGNSCDAVLPVTDQKQIEREVKQHMRRMRKSRMMHPRP